MPRYLLYQQKLVDFTDSDYCGTSVFIIRIPRQTQYSDIKNPDIQCRVIKAYKSGYPNRPCASISGFECFKFGFQSIWILKHEILCFKIRISGNQGVSVDKHDGIMHYHISNQSLHLKLNSTLFIWLFISTFEPNAIKNYFLEKQEC